LGYIHKILCSILVLVFIQNQEDMYPENQNNTAAASLPLFRLFLVCARMKTYGNVWKKAIFYFCFYIFYWKDMKGIGNGIKIRGYMKMDKYGPRAKKN